MTRELVMLFDAEQARQVAQTTWAGTPTASAQISGFVELCRFLSQHPDSLSWRGQRKPDVQTPAGLASLAGKYLAGWQASAFPGQPSTVPDAIVSEVMQGQCQV